MITCHKGVRQGENLSPLLFALYLNDVEAFMSTNNCEGISLEPTNITDAVKLFLLLYADDTVLLANSPTGLQQCLDMFNQYCQSWKLSINISKTKAVIFGSGYQRNRLNFHLGDLNVPISDSYTYLGIKFHKNRQFNYAMRSLKQQSLKAMFLILNKSRNCHIPLDCQFIAFDHMVIPILLYGSEVWGHSNTTILESVHQIICCMEKQEECLLKF